MLNDFEKFEEKVEEQVARNNKIIDGFRKWLKQNKLNEKTIRKHVNNVSLYANHYLQYNDITPIEEGHRQIDYYFGYWFKHKVMSSVSGLKENITSIKKLYTYLHSINQISKLDLEEMNFFIKEAKCDWIEEANEYFNDLMEDYW